MCEICTDPGILAAIQHHIHGRGINYCPVCGEPLVIGEFLRMLDELGNSIFSEPKPDNTVDGMIFEDTTDKYSCSKGLGLVEDEPHIATVSDMSVDLDKIDISKEMEMLEKHDQKKKKEREERDECIRRSFESFLRKKYLKED